LEAVLHSAKQSLLVASPYIKTKEAEWLCQQVSENSKHDSFHLRVLTDIRSSNVLAGSLDVGALHLFQTTISNCEIINLPRLHAKMYVADDRCALVTSANLTPSGLDYNLEYGVAISDGDSVRQVRQDFDRYACLGNALDLEKITELEAIAENLKAEFDELKRSQEKKICRQFDAKLKAANTHFLRAQIGNRSPHGLFADAMVYLLSERPLSTKELHLKIKGILPDLCDDETELIIDGKAFGKKWKHIVRNAQVFLRRADRIGLREGRWVLLKGEQ